MRRKVLVLLVWLLCMLFPMAWLGRFSLAYRRLFDTLFGPEWMHIVMHLILFAGLAILWLVIFKPRSLRAILLLVGVVLLVGSLQEIFQMISGGTRQGYLPAAVRFSAFDLLVDLTGAFLGLGLVYLLLAARRLVFPSTSNLSVHD